METAESIGNLLANDLKKLGYKKRKLTWYKNNTETTVVFTIQKSQFSSDTWYYCFGIGLNAFFSKAISSISSCDIIYRVDQRFQGRSLSPKNIIDILVLWENKYGIIDSLRVIAIEGKLPPQTTNKAIRFLTSGFYENVYYGKDNT